MNINDNEKKEKGLQIGRKGKRNINELAEPRIWTRLVRQLLVLEIDCNVIVSVQSSSDSERYY
jgi:hypothetical protein